MSTVGDIAEGSIPVVVTLVRELANIVNAKDSAAELAALQTTAEAVKFRMDQLKFPNEQHDSPGFEPGNRS